MSMKDRMVSAEQWDLPVSIDPNGNFISLREFTEKNIATLSSGSESLAEEFTLAEDLELEDQAILVEKRMAHLPDFKLAMVGIGIVDKERAIQEVRKQTSAGLTLIEIELHTIARMLEHVQGGTR